MNLTKGVKLRRNSVGLVLKETVDVQTLNREKCNYLKMCPVLLTKITASKWQLQTKNTRACRMYLIRNM